MQNREAPQDEAACYTCRSKRNGHWAPKTDLCIGKLPVLKSEAEEALRSWFANEDEIPLLHRVVPARVAYVAEKAGIDRDVRPLDLHHTYGTKLWRRGADPHLVCRVIGCRIEALNRYVKHSAGNDDNSSNNSDNDE